ncbi:MAG: hypothetical protein A2915_00910 [Candidatus Yanofskybacteria bacterium RIFCSPLOWO2_01_FULL_41_34]|nr:MAG: hypothetical protein A2915_00910 [Candidatus Yanofskybacteria bacterium RIFCSPLOWO2_01_FULL_41_34]
MTELKNHIRFEMVKNPNVSILELQVVLRDTYHHNFDKNFIGKLKRKVHRERAVRYNFSSLNEELAKLEDLMHFGRQQLMDILFDESGKYKPSEIIYAFRAVMWGGFTLLEAKLNSGIFNRPQAPEKEKPLSPEQQEAINRGIDMMYSGICDKCADFHYRESHEKEKTIQITTE